jgi:hypothetical protein
VRSPRRRLNAHQFLIDFGHNTINNFQPAIDIIQLQQAQSGSIANVLADIHQVGADSVPMLEAVPPTPA